MIGENAVVGLPVAVDGLDHAPTTARAFAIALLATAVLIVAARWWAPFEVQKDQALQTQAAFRLASGLGLTSTSNVTASPDIALPPQATYLTWWPPAFSVVIAVFLRAGIPLWAALRILYGAATLIGWVGWAEVGRSVVPGVRTRTAGRVLVGAAILLPIAVTPSWGGTDIFLWTGVAWFVRALSIRPSAEWSMSRMLAAGALAGVLCLVRYASAFLCLAGLLAIAWLLRRDLRQLAVRAAQFIAGFGIGAAPAVLFNIWASASALPAYVGQNVDGPAADGWLQHAPVVTSLWIGAPLVPRMLEHLPNGRLLLPVVGVAALLLAVLLPAASLAAVKDADTRAGRTVAVLTLVPTALVVFLLAAEAATTYGPLGTPRYYEPAALCWFLVWLYFAFGQPSPRPPLRAVAYVGVGLVGAQLLVFLPAQGLVARTRGRVVQATLGFTPSRSPDPDVSSTSAPVEYPSLSVYTRKESSREAVRALSRARPDAIFYILGSHQLYAFDDGALGPDSSAVRNFPPRSFWATAYTSQAVRVYWVREISRQLWQASDFDFVPADNLKRVFIDAVERTEIFESNFPAGYRFIR